MKPTKLTEQNNSNKIKRTEKNRDEKGIERKREKKKQQKTGIQSVESVT